MDNIGENVVKFIKKFLDLKFIFISVINNFINLESLPLYHLSNVVNTKELESFKKLTYLDIEGIRHPIIERIQTDYEYITNDIKLDNILEISEYKNIELEKLNLNIFQNLSREDDSIVVTNNNTKFLILVCEIDYDKQLATNKLFN